MFEQERRRTERLLLVPPIDARVQNHPVRLVDIGALGTRVEHEQPLVAGGPQKLGRFSSGLSFTGSEPRSLRRVIDSLADRDEMDRLRTLVEASKLIHSSIEPDALFGSILTVARNKLRANS